MNQSSVSHYLNGVNPLNANVASAFAKILEVPVADFSQRLAQQIADLVTFADDMLHKAAAQKALENIRVDTSGIEPNMELLGDLSVWDEGDPLDEDDCEVPYYAEVEFAGGDGMTEVIEVAEGTCVSAMPL